MIDKEDIIMAKWDYIITNGKELREAIDNENAEQTVKCLITCCEELLHKLNRRDKEDFEEDMNDIIDTLYDIDSYDEDAINDCLSDFYDICDYVKAWVEM